MQAFILFTVAIFFLGVSRDKKYGRDAGWPIPSNIWEDKFWSNLPTEMAEYANTHFETYVKEADLKQQILTDSGAR